MEYLFPPHRYIRKTITAVLAIMFCTALAEHGRSGTEFILAFFMVFTVAKGNTINELWFLTIPIGWVFTTLLLFTIGYGMIEDWGYVLTTWISMSSFTLFILFPVSTIANYLMDD